MSGTTRAKARNPRERLVHHVQNLERLDRLKVEAGEEFRAGLAAAKGEGYDGVTLKAVLQLRKMSPGQRSERRALEAIYLAALGMLEGDGLPEEARRRLDAIDHAPTPAPSPAPPPDAAQAPPDGEPSLEAATPAPKPREPEQPPLIRTDQMVARREGAQAAAAGKRIYDNPYRAGDPARAAWDEGWCSQQKSHGMETPAAYQRRTEKKDPSDKDAGGGAESGAA